MKKSTLILLAGLLLLCSLGIACDDEPTQQPAQVPNPGFAIVTTRRRGSREIPLGGSVTDGRLLRRDPGSSGSVARFTGATASKSGRADINGGIAPAFWRFFAIRNWDDCTGQTFSGGVERGQLNYFVCEDIPLFVRGAVSPAVSSQLSPNTIDVNAAQVEFTAYSDSINCTYGMPTFQFINEYGTFVAQTQASTVAYDNTSATGWSGCLAGFPTGSYSVRIINATADGVGEQAGTAAFYLYGGPVQKAIDDASFFVRQQYLDFYNREPDAGGWDFWSSQITQCGADATCIHNKRIDVSRAFWYSDEFLQQHPGLRNPAGVYPDFNNAEFVSLCYTVYLRRSPDQSGYDGWLSYLNSTNDYNGVINGFIASDEYRTRFDPPPPIIEVPPDPEPCEPCRLNMACMPCYAY